MSPQTSVRYLQFERGGIVAIQFKVLPPGFTGAVRITTVNDTRINGYAKLREVCPGGVGFENQTSLFANKFHHSSSNTLARLE